MENCPIILDEHIHSLYRGRQTMRTLMRTRGYVPMVDPHEATLDTFLQFYAHMTSWMSLTIRAWKNEQLILAFFPPEPKLRIGPVREICDYAKDCRASHFIIVFTEQITSFTKTHITHYRVDNNVKIETFSLPQLQFNVVEHEMVPPHKLLKDDEKREVLKKYRVTPEQLPRILLSDPIAKYYGARVGQVFEITNASPLGFFYPSYRIVCKGVYKHK